MKLSNTQYMCLKVKQLYEPCVHGKHSLVSRLQYCRRDLPLPYLLHRVARLKTVGIGNRQLRCLHLPPPKHQYPRRYLKIQRKHSIQNCSTCCFASGNPSKLSDQIVNKFCSQHYIKTRNCTVNSPSLLTISLTKIGQFQRQSHE